jgi:hypothetical protein
MMASLIGVVTSQKRKKRDGRETVITNKPWARENHHKT